MDSIASVKVRNSLDNLHGAAAGSTAGTVASYSWNLFRYIADYLHLLGVVVLLGTLLRTASCTGLSFRTQALYLTVFICRYLDLFERHQRFYLVFFKIAYICSSAVTCAAFYRWPSSYEKRRDTCNVTLILVGCFVGALITSEHKTVTDVLWTCSEWLEGFAMVPQYIFCYRGRGGHAGSNKRTDVAVSGGGSVPTRTAGLEVPLGVHGYICCVGGYRVFYALNWMYKYWQLGARYSDLNSWLGGLIEILFFADYLNFRARGTSILRGSVLAVDQKLNEIQETVEMRVLAAAGSSRVVEATTTELGGLRKRRGGGQNGHSISEEEPEEGVLV